MTLLQELRYAVRFLARAKGLSATVVVTLALGIGANAAIFSLVRAVLLRPLVNRDENRILYVRQSARGIGAENATFSVPEIRDLRERVKTLTAIGEFSTITFTAVGLGDPRQVRAGVVNGNYFDVMGLRPVLGRLLTADDDGPSATGAAVLTYRFWTTALHGDATVLGKTIRLGTCSAVIVGVVEPSVPYPAETELIANVVTSPHHLSATMVTGREHRMTEVFGRLAPSADLEAARAELRDIHSTIVREHPEAYSATADFRIGAVRLRDQITARARTVLLVLFGASGLVFVIACSNVANLVLARTVRREPELAVRAALGADTRALRRMLLAESLLLCGSGAALGVAMTGPMIAVLARYAARFSLRALDLKVDFTLLWVGVVLALLAAVLLAFVPRLPSADGAHGLRSSSGSPRVTGATNRRLQVFAVTQIAASFVLLAGAGMLLRTFLALQATAPGFETERLLAINVPVTSYGRTPQQIRQFYREVQARTAAIPGVEGVAVGSTVPWRDAGGRGGFGFRVEGWTRDNERDNPRARFRSVSPGFFAALGVRVLAGRDFTDADRDEAERVVIVSASLAQQLFPGRDVLNRRLTWTDGIMKFIGVSGDPRRIVGVVADIDDEHIAPVPAMTVYHPFDQEIAGGRVFVHARTDPYSLVPAVTRIVRELATDQPVEQAATLDDVRAEVLAPDRLNTLVFGGFAGVALAVAVVGVAGVLAFSVSGRTREFGVRLAIGSRPQQILMGVLKDGLAIASVGVVIGGLGGLAVARLAASYVEQVQLPGTLPVLAAATVLLVAVLVASFVPAARAARVDVTQALRSD
jgi:predicted permease